jgi:hypothetical protein
MVTVCVVTPVIEPLAPVMVNVYVPAGVPDEPPPGPMLPPPALQPMFNRAAPSATKQNIGSHSLRRRGTKIIRTPANTIPPPPNSVNTAVRFLTFAVVEAVVDTVMDAV